MMSAAFATLLAACVIPGSKPRATSVTPAAPGLRAPPVAPAPPLSRTAFGDPIADALQALEEAMARLQAGTRRSRKRAPRPSELN
jgi:hypothetical protein